MSERKTVGQICKELMDNPDPKQGVIDTRMEMNKKFLPQIEECIKNHKNLTDPFYVLVINRRERLITNVIRQIFTARRTLPTPDYDQTVFKYFPSTGDLKFLWVVPDIATVDDIIFNKKNIPQEQWDLLRFCMLFKEEKLDKVCGE